MNQTARLDEICALIQEDACGRGLRTDPEHNLVNACTGDFAAACRDLSQAADGRAAIVTGFLIPDADPPRGETDGPLGAVFLARVLHALGMQVVLATDPFCEPALHIGLEESGLMGRVKVMRLPPGPTASSTRTHSGPNEASADTSCLDYWEAFTALAGPLTHLIAIERVGPNHTEASLRAQLAADEPRASATAAEVLQTFLATVPPERRGRYHSMRGFDITEQMAPAHLLFEAARTERGTKASRCPVTIGIGDGGNEIGMGKVAWEVIARNVPRGGLVACQTPTDFLIPCGISNWGAYGLGYGTALLHGGAMPDLFDVDREHRILRRMVEEGGLIDGPRRRASVSVDGLDFDCYAEPLRRMLTL